jgi:hypothetical protein
MTLVLQVREENDEVEAYFSFLSLLILFSLVILIYSQSLFSSFNFYSLF